MLDVNIDLSEINKTIIKTKKQISHNQIIHPLVDEEINYLTLKDE